MNMLKSVLRGLLFAGGLAGAAVAQPSGVLVGPIGGGTGGSAVSLTCGTGFLCSPNPITGTGSITSSVFQNDQVGTSYALLTTDGGKIVAGANASAQAYSLSAASTTGFGSGYGFDLYNRGAGALTLTATTSTFGNALTTLVLAQGQEAYIAADSASTNYLSFVSLPVMATNTVLGNVAAANYPVALTTTQLTTLVNAFSSSLSGAAPASGGGTTNFLRADGSWAAPSGGSGCTVSGTVNQIVSNNGSSACQSSATTATTAGNIVNPFAGIASTPALLFSASPFAGSGTTSFPALYFNNNATAPTTFSTAGTYFGANAASTSNNFFDMYVGTAEKAVLSGFGVLTLAGTTSCGTGAIVCASIISASSSGDFELGTRVSLSSPGNNFLQIGPLNSAAPAAQTIGAWSGLGTNIAGQTFTLVGSIATGNASSGDFVLQTGGAVGSSGTASATATNAIVIKGVTQLVELPQITSDAGLTDASVCEDTTLHGLHAGSGTLGICLGTSSERYKHGIDNLQPGLTEIMRLKTKSFYLNIGHGDPTKMYYGFMAEDVVHVLPKLVGLDKQQRPNTVDYLGMVPVLVKAVQEQQAEIEQLRRHEGLPIRNTFASRLEWLFGL